MITLFKLLLMLLSPFSVGMLIYNVYKFPHWIMRKRATSYYISETEKERKNSGLDTDSLFNSWKIDAYGYKDFKPYWASLLFYPSAARKLYFNGLYLKENFANDPEKLREIDEGMKYIRYLRVVCKGIILLLEVLFIVGILYYPIAYNNRGNTTLGSLFEKGSYDAQYYVYVQNDPQSAKWYKLKADIHAASHYKAFIVLPYRTDRHYFVTRIYWPNGGYSSFVNREIYADYEYPDEYYEEEGERIFLDKASICSTWDYEYDYYIRLTDEPASTSNFDYGFNVRTVVIWLSILTIRTVYFFFAYKPYHLQRGGRSSQ